MSSDHKATMDFPKEQARGTNTNTQKLIVHPEVRPKAANCFTEKNVEARHAIPEVEKQGATTGTQFDIKNPLKTQTFPKNIETQAYESQSAKAGNAPSLRGEVPSLPIFNDRARLRPQRVDKEERREMHKEQRRGRKRKREKRKHKELGKKKFHAVWKAEGVIVKKKPAMRRQLAK